MGSGSSREAIRAEMEARGCTWCGCECYKRRKDLIYEIKSAIRRKTGPASLDNCYFEIDKTESDYTESSGSARCVRRIVDGLTNSSKNW